MSDSRVALLALLAFALGGCGAGEDRTLEDISQQTYPLDRDATFRIKNLDGAIRIYGSDKPEMIVETIKKAYSAERLKGIVAKVSVQPGSAQIDTIYPSPSKRWSLADRSGTVDYNIVLPQGCRLTSVELANGEILIDGMRSPSANARLINGRLIGHNCFGDLNFAVVTGNIDFVFEWWEEEKSSVLGEVVNGNIFAALPDDSSFTLTAETVNGQIGSTFGESDEPPAEPMRYLRTAFGPDIRSDIKVRTTNGNIKVEETFQDDR
jgi:hypothetical protein